FKNFSAAEFQQKTLRHFTEQEWPLTFNFRHKGTPLFIDLRNPAGIRLFGDLLGHLPTVTIEEAVGGGQPGDAWLHDGPRAFTHELIVPFRNEHYLKREPVAAKVIAPEREATVVRNYLPASEWLYFKLYAGVNATEKIIAQRLPVLLPQLKQAGLIDAAFFLRYHDSDHHLRLRVRLADTNAAGSVLNRVRDFFAPEIRTGYVWKFQIDTYQRELERYGYRNITAAETIFDLDSSLHLRCKSLLTAEARQELGWLLLLRATQIYLDVFLPDAAEQLSFLRERRETFFAIFNTNKVQKRELTLRYKDRMTEIAALLENERLPFDQTEDFRQALAVFERELRRVFDRYFGDAELPALRDYLGSYIHMSILRFVKCKNKKHEHVLYYFLERYHLQKEMRTRRMTVPHGQA
ncbi:MAG: thiopeptide-type bacteriocin biosynthesis protein, partial [Bacteroidota bacterium]